MSVRIHNAIVIALVGAGFSSHGQAQTDHSAHGAHAAKPAMAITQNGNGTRHSEESQQNYWKSLHSA